MCASERGTIRPNIDGKKEMVLLYHLTESIMPAVNVCWVSNCCKMAKNTCWESALDTKWKKRVMQRTKKNKIHEKLTIGNIPREPGSPVTCNFWNVFSVSLQGRHYKTVPEKSSARKYRDGRKLSINTANITYFWYGNNRKNSVCYTQKKSNDMQTN